MKETYKMLLDSIEQHHHLFNNRNDQLQKKIIEYASCDEIRENLKSSRFRIDYRGYHFECLFSENNSYTKNLYVIYNGARKEGIMPYFPRWTYHGILPGHMLCIEDPMYYMYEDLKLGWFYGNKEESLLEISIDIIKAVCDSRKIDYRNIIFFSSSGGGYSSIFVKF